MTESITAADGDYIDDFCRRHPNVSPAELRYCIRIGSAEVRLYLSECGVMDDYPRAPKEARRENIEVE